MYLLYVDDRERAISQLLDYNSINVKVERLTRGDYAIVWVSPDGKHQRLVDIIERKTLEDYARSIKDGRIANINSLLEARAETGCAITLIVEGPLDPHEDTLFDKTPYKTISSSVMNMKTRYQISSIFTRDQFKTAAKLKQLLDSYEHVHTSGSFESNLPITLIYTAPRPIATQSLLNAPATENPTIIREPENEKIIDKSTGTPELKMYVVTKTGIKIRLEDLIEMIDKKVQIGTNGTDNVSHIVIQPNTYAYTRIGTVGDIIKGSIEHNIADDIQTSRRAIQGIGIEGLNSTLIFSVADMVNDISCLNNVKTNSGKKLSKAVQNGVLNLATDTGEGIKFLSAIHGVSKTLAAFIMKGANGSFPQLCTLNEKELSAMVVKKTETGKPQRLGDDMAKRIHFCLHYKAAGLGEI